MKTINTWLPIFPGFYSTIFEPDEEPEIEYINNIRKEKGLSELDYDRFNFDYDEYQNNVARECTNFIESELKKLNIIDSLEFEKVNSPKEYNFENDSIYIKVNLTDDNIKNIKNYLFENIESFKSYIKNRYTSYSGFISFFSNDYKEWLNKIDLCLEDKHQLGSILDFILNDLSADDMDYSLSNNYLSATNLEELENMEYCMECKEWAEPNNFDGNMCKDCLEYSENYNISNCSHIFCTKCKDEIASEQEKRHIKYLINIKEISPAQIMCNECIQILMPIEI